MIAFGVGFTSGGQSAKISRHALKIRREIHETQSELVSGQAHDRAKALNGATGEALQINAQRSADIDLLPRLSMAASRAQSQQNALTHVMSIVDALASDIDILASASDATSLDVLLRSTQRTFEDVISKLNTTYGGRGLFSGDGGSAAIAPPDDVIAAAQSLAGVSTSAAEASEDVQRGFLLVGGIFDQHVWLGGSGPAPSISFRNGESKSEHLEASNDEVRSLLGTLSAAILTLQDTNLQADERVNLIRKMSYDLRKSISDFSLLNSRAGAFEAQIIDEMYKINSEHTVTHLYYSDSLSIPTERSATHLRHLENQLETLYITSGRIANLTLSRYLK